MALSKNLIPIRIAGLGGVESFRLIFPEMIRVARHEESGIEVYLTRNHKGLNVLIPLDAFSSEKESYEDNEDVSRYHDEFVTTCPILGFPVGIDADQRISFKFCQQLIESTLYRKSQDDELLNYLKNKKFRISIWAECRQDVFTSKDAVFTHLV